MPSLNFIQDTFLVAPADLRGLASKQALLPSLLPRQAGAKHVDPNGVHHSHGAPLCLAGTGPTGALHHPAHPADGWHQRALPGLPSPPGLVLRTK